MLIFELFTAKGYSRSREPQVRYNTISFDQGPESGYCGYFCFVLVSPLVLL